MYAYLDGIIVAQNADSIVIDVNNIGYLVRTANPYVFKVGEKTKVFTHQYVREDTLDLFGFQNENEKELFLKLISVKGIGPKGALAILATGSVTGIVSAIESGNSSYLRKFPGIGPKASQQIILDLQGKFEDEGLVNTDIIDVKEVLVSLGYSTREINKVLPKIDVENSSLDEMVKSALQLMLK
jgi:Holliday junction DNA helicase RuvA